MLVFPSQVKACRRYSAALLLPLFVCLSVNISAQDSSLGSSKEQREAADAKLQQMAERDQVNAMLQEKRNRRNTQLNTDTMTPEVREAWNRYENKSYPSTASGTQQAERDFLMLESNWGAVQAEAHKGNIRPVDATRFSQEHKQEMSARGNVAAKQVDPSLEVEGMPANPNAKDKPYSDHDGQLRGVVVDDKGTRAPVTAQQAADTRSQFDKNVNEDLKKHGLPELENPSATMKSDAMANTDNPREHRASAEHQNRAGGTVYQDPVAKDMELKNQQYDADGVSAAEKSSAMDKARYANEQGRQQDIHRRKQDRELARGLQLVKDNPDVNSPGHKAGLEALQNSQAQADYGVKYADRLNKTTVQASNNAKVEHGVDTSVSPKLQGSIDKLKTDRTVNSTVESATAAATYENNQANQRSQATQIFAHDGEYEAAAEMIRNADASTKGDAIESLRVGAAARKEAELLADGLSAGEARLQAEIYGDTEAGNLAAAMRENSTGDVLDPTHDNFELNSTELEDTDLPDQPDTTARVFGAAKTGMDAAIAIGTGVKATNDYIEGSEAEALANESQARFDALNEKDVLSKEETDQALAESNETLKQRVKAGKKGDAAKGGVAFSGQLAGMVAGEATEAGSAAVGVALDSYEAGNSAYKAADAHSREQRLRAKAAELNEKGLTEQAQKFSAMADRERETKLTELEKSAAAAGKTGLGIAGAAGAGTAMQAGAAAASLPAAVVVGGAAGAFGSGYGATRAAVDNTRAGLTMEAAKANWMAGKDAKVVASEGTALSQHARLKGKYEAVLDNGQYTLSEGFDRGSFESAMASAEETGNYSYVRTMMEKNPEKIPRTAKQGFLRAEPRYPDVDARINERPMTDMRDVNAVAEKEDYRDFDPAEKRPEMTGLRAVPLVEEMENFGDFDPAGNSAASLDEELASLVFEMEQGQQRATRQLDAERRSGSVSRTTASLERTSAARTVTSHTQIIQVASAQAAKESQRSLQLQADRITHKQKERAAQQEREKAAAQQRYDDEWRQTTVPEVFSGSGSSATTTGNSSGAGSGNQAAAGYSSGASSSAPTTGYSSGAGSSSQTTANTSGLSPACRESVTLASQMSELEARARSGDQSALAQFQSLARRSQSVQAACQKSIPLLAAPTSSHSSSVYTGDECGPVIYGIPKTKEECERYKAAH